MKNYPICYLFITLSIIVNSCTEGFKEEYSKLFIVLTEVTAITTPTTDTTPDYTFSSTLSGALTYGGSCSSSTTIATTGNNTITLNTLSVGTYADCTITVSKTISTEKSENKLSGSLTITSFTVDSTTSTLTEVTAVTTPTNDTTPDYTFSSTKAGTITYGGSCSSGTTSATTDDNTITLVSLTEDTYSNCTITVTDNSSNSVTLNISSFVIDTTAPTVSSVSTTADNQSWVSITDNITVTFSEAMDNTSVTTNTDNASCSGTLRVSSDNFSSCVKMSSTPASSTDNKTFTLDPYDNLTSSTTYKTRVTTGVKDTAGNALSSQYETSSGFTTSDDSCSATNDSTLLAHYAFEGNLNDSSSYDRHLTEVGSNITYSAADNQSNKSGRAALFSGFHPGGHGSNTYAYTTDITLSDNFTVAFWTKPDSPNMVRWDSALSTGDSQSSGRFQIDYKNNQIRFSGSSEAQLEADLNSNQWNHIVITKSDNSTDDKTVRMYTGGLLRDNESGVTTRWDKIKIGKSRTNNRYWSGYIDEVKIYNRALSAQEVLDLYECY